MSDIPVTLVLPSGGSRNAEVPTYVTTRIERIPSPLQRQVRLPNA